MSAGIRQRSGVLKMYAVPAPKLPSERAGKRTPAGMPVHVAATAGILVERWVFFAKATRTVRLYYRLNSPAALAWLSCSLAGAAAEQTSAPLPKFMIHRGTFLYEVRKQRRTSGFMTLVLLFDLKFLTEFAAGAVGTSIGGTRIRATEYGRRCASRLVSFAVSS